MAKKGQSKTALSAAIISSFVGGVFGAVVLSFLGPSIARVALKLSIYDYFGIILFALCTVKGNDVIVYDDRAKKLYRIDF